MEKQLYFEDITEGTEVPALVKYPTTMQLVKYAAASGDFYQIHYDKDFALASGLPGIIVHGWLALAFLGEMVTGWIGDKGMVLKLNGSYRGMNRVHEDLICNGKVTKKYTENGQNYAKLDIWVENPQGDKTVTGNAVIALPSRS
jgi:hydroxyacyl-ACP dehydratase HTD2-like protein with hotdog domain